MANPFRRADRHGAPSIRPTPPESAENRCRTQLRPAPYRPRPVTYRSTGRRRQALRRQWNRELHSNSLATGAGFSTILVTGQWVAKPLFPPHRNRDSLTHLSWQRENGD